MRITKLFTVVCLRILFVLLFLSEKGFSQSQLSYDSLINKICKTLAENKSEDDSVKIKLIANQHLIPYLEQFEKTKANDVSNDIFIRAQRQCKDFGDLVFKLTPKNSNWVRVDKKPESKLKKPFCRNLLQFKKYQYVELNGDTVNLTINQGFWIDHFKDGTFSKLKLRWLSDCEFQIMFIESNNAMRKNFSKVGDKYNYQILEKSDNYYLMSAEIVGTNQFMTFKLYF